MSAEIIRLRAQLAADRAAFRRRVANLLDKPPPADEAAADHFALNAHHAYSAVESMLERVARALEGGLPQGPSWHRELLENAFLDLPGLRPAVFSAASAPVLRELMGFRHFVRHAYDATLDLELLADRRELVAAALNALEADLDALDAFLAQLAPPPPAG